MKKIPTLFERVFEKGRIVGITRNVTPGFEWVLEGEGEATVKIDGSCCAVYDRVFYKRYDAKKGKTPPADAIPCTPEPDPITGHWPHWVPVKLATPGDHWFVVALENSDMSRRKREDVDNKTYEAIGPHFNGNPYHLTEDTLVEHGVQKVEVERTFEGIRHWLETHDEEGLVFWRDGEPQCKIKRSDFGLSWPVKEEKENE